MIRDLIIEVTPLLVAALILLFIAVKMFAISRSLNKNYISLFFTSLMFFNRVTIRNTFHEQLKKYYKKSNNVNMVFYAVIAALLLVYALMAAI